MAGITLVNGADGVPVLVMDQVKNLNLNGVGTVNGSGTFAADLDSQGNSVYAFGNSTDDECEFVNQGKDGNYSFSGENFDVEMNDYSSVKWDASDSSLTMSDGNDYLMTTENSKNNVINMGGGTNILVDSGSNNMVESKGTSVVATTASSKNFCLLSGAYNDSALAMGSGACMDLGAGDDTAKLYGNNGNIAFTGDGDDKVYEFLSTIDTSDASQKQYVASFLSKYMDKAQVQLLIANLFE